MSECESISSVSDTEVEATAEFQGASVQFVIPLHYEDLTLPATSGRFTAKLVPDAQLQPYLTMLQEVNSELQVDPTCISDNKNFDPIYSLIAKWDKLNSQIHKKLINLLTENMNKLVYLFSEDEYSSLLYKNCLKMFSYLLSCLISRGEAAVSAIESESQKSLKNAPRSGKSTDENAVSHVWTSHREKILQSFSNMCKSEKLNSLWKLSSSKDLKQQIGDIIFRSAFLLLENPQNLKSKSLKEMCIKTLAEVISSFDVQIEATNFCMQSLLRIDSKTYPIALAELLGEYQMIDQLKGTSFIGAIVREIGKLDADSFGKDSTSSKSVGLFLESLAEHAPTAVLANVSVLLSHLDLDNYVIRNGVVQLIGKLLLFLHQKVTEEETERSEEDRNERVKSNSGKTRDSLLDLLKERVNDVSSYTRSRVLQTWKELADQNAIPVRFFAVVCNCAVERLDDKSLIVSKGAIQLLTSLLQNNPFGPQLRLQDFRSHYQSHLESMSRKEILYCKAAILFLEIFDASLDKILSHLSHGISSIMECIEFIKVANQFQIQDAEKGLKRLLPLIVSMNKEKEIRDSIVNAYAEVFLPENGNPRHSASNLVKLALSVSFSEKKCLSQIISDLARIKRIGKPVMSAIWEIFSVNQAEKVHLKRGALEIIAMVGFAHVSVISSNLKDILQEVFSPMNEQDEVLVRTAFVMMQNLGEIPDFEIEGKPVNEFVLQKVEDVLLGKIAVGPNWFGSAEQAINLLYSLHGEPSSIAISVLRRWIENLDLNSSQTISSRDLSQLFFVVGHISLKLLEQVDLIDSKVNRLKRKPGADNVQGSKVNEGSGIEEVVSLNSYDDFEIESLRSKAEQGITAQDNLLGIFAPLVIGVCSNPTKFNGNNLQMSATLALSKMMCSNSDFCEKNLQLLFTLLKKSGDPRVRSDILIGLGDLAVRFPNLIDPWTKNMFSCLRDTDQSVRKSTLMVLTHLVLNDMLKVKSDISEIARCVTDENQAIIDAAKHFFTEIAKKNSAIIYNLLPATINCLLQDSSTSQDQFRKIFRFLIPLIADKERQGDAFIHKLCQKFDGTLSVTFAKEIMFCISLLSFQSEKSISKFVSYFKNFKEFLYDAEFCSIVGEIVEKMRKTSASKPEVQQSIDEFENLMQKLLNGELDPELVKENMPAASQLQEMFTQKGKKKGAKSRSKKATNSSNKKAQPSRKSQARKLPAKTKRYIDSDSEDSVDLASDVSDDVQISQSD